MMRKLRVAVLGIGSIGEFHAREFKYSGCEVVAILTSSSKSAREKSEKLKRLYGINAKPYSDLAKLFENEELDAISVCTPIETHFDYVKRCLENDVNVLCEKPFVFGSSSGNYDASRELFDLARRRGKVLSCNTQMVSLLDSVPVDFISNVRSFSMYMEPPWDDVNKLVVDAISHMNSFLVKLIGEKDVGNLKFAPRDSGGVTVSFDYGKCKVKYVFGVKKTRPRKFYFDINGVRFDRDASDYNNQRLLFDGRSVDAKDPLSVSIGSFVSACRGTGHPLVNEDDILQNVSLQDLIVGKLIENKNVNF